jgi:multiple sugar transport system substrate-binding protein
MKRLMLLMSLVLLSGALVFAGGSSESETTDGTGPVQDVHLSFTVWSGFEGHLSMLNEIAAAYRAEHPNVSVSFSIIPFAEYVSKVTIQLAGSNPPGAGWLVETSAPAYVDAGVLVDLRDAVGQYDFNDFSEAALGLWTRGDAVYGVPFSTSPFIMIYNKSLFNQAGVPDPDELAAAGDWTWERFAEVSKAIKDATGVWGFQTVDGQGYDVRVWHNLLPMVRSYGADAWDQDGNCRIAEPGAVKAVQLFHDMVYRDKSVVPPGNESDFYAGNAAMTVGQISRVGKLEDARFEWGIAPLPGGPEGSSPVIGQAAVVAFAASKNRDAAADFAAFMTSKENVKKMAEYFPPARKSVLESDAFLEANPLISREDMAVVADAIKNGRALSFHRNFPKIDLASRSQFDALWNPDADVQQILQNVCDAITPLLLQ